MQGNSISQAPGMPFFACEISEKPKTWRNDLMNILIWESRNYCEFLLKLDQRGFTRDAPPSLKLMWAFLARRLLELRRITT